MADGFGDLARRYERVVGELNGKGGRRRLGQVGMRAKPEIAHAVRGDIGDLSMSGWRRGAEVEITGRFDVVSDTAVVMSPEKRARGGMRVLQSGRNHGDASGFQGPGVNRSTGETQRTKSGGVRKVRARQGRRWNGVTDGKETWTHAEERLSKVMSGYYHDEFVADTTRLLRGR